MSPDLIEAAGIVVTVQDINNVHEKEAQDKKNSANAETAGEMSSKGVHVLV